MNTDRFFPLLALSFLPILFLPQNVLLYACLFGSIIALLSLITRQWLTMLLGLLIALNYWQIDQRAKSAANLTACKCEHQFEVVRILKQTDYQTAIVQLETGAQIYLTWQADTPLLLHQQYRANLTLRPISGRLNIGNFNRQRWYFANHLNGIGTVKNAQLLETENLPLRTHWLMRVKQQTATLPSQGLLLALAFGERAWLKADDWQPFQQTATAHLIAISGLHIALAFAIGFGLVKSILWLLMPMKWWAVRNPLNISLLGGTLFAFGYSYLAGFAIPTERALFAIFCVLMLHHCRRHYTALQLWWRIVAMLLLLDPIALLSDSFWLSILSVLSLILWYNYFPLKQFYQVATTGKVAKPLKFIVSLIHLQLGILLIFTPVQFFFFDGTSPFAFLANLLIVPLYSLLLVPLILLSLLTDNLLHTWQLCDWLASWSVKCLTPLAHAWLTLSQTSQWTIISINLLLVLLLFYWKRRKPRLIWLLLIALSVYICGFIPNAFQPKARWIMFDVGQGLAMGLVSGKNIVLYDTGASWENSSMAKLELLPYLARNGLNVDAIFLSHDDNDHAGGVADIIAAYPNARLISASQKSYANKMPESCLAGKQWQFGEFEIIALYPKLTPMRAKNADSCTLLVTVLGKKILLTGDLNQQNELEIAKQIGKIDFLQVPHHGSKTSTSETLLFATQPQIALVSTGRFNVWKMPNSVVVKRLEKHQIALVDTAKTGMIWVDFAENDWKIHSARHALSAWYARFYP